MKRDYIKYNPPINKMMMLGYVLIAIDAYIVANRIINYIFVLVSIIMLLDGICFFMSMRKIDIKMDFKQEVLKNETFQLKMIFHNKGVISSPFIEFIPKESKRIHLKTSTGMGLVLRHKQQVAHDITYEAHLCGLEQMYIGKVRYNSYFSFFKKEEIMNQELYIKVLPCTMTLSGVEHFTEYIDQQEHLDEKQRGRYKSINGDEMVGYELRPYVMGDSQRLIHWKLAMYKDELLVRKRETDNTIRREIVFILNPFLIEESDRAIWAQDKLLTSFISLIDYYFKQEEKVTVIYYREKIWHDMSIKKGNHLRGLQGILGDYEMLKEETSMNLEEILQGLRNILHPYQRTGTNILVSHNGNQPIQQYLYKENEKIHIKHIWTESKVLKTLKDSAIPIGYISDAYHIGVYGGDK